jgi:hypothetical protein
VVHVTNLTPGSDNPYVKGSEHFFNYLHYVDYAVVQPGYNETPAVPDLVGLALFPHGTRILQSKHQ